MSLTSHLRNKGSPVRLFLSSEFPNGKPPRQALALTPLSSALVVTNSQLPIGPLPRTWSAPAALVLPDRREGFPWSTVGTAVDFRLRFCLSGSFESARVAAAGARRLAQHWLLSDDIPRAFSELAVRFKELMLRDTDWSRSSTKQTSSYLAQYCYVLALYEQCYRANFTDEWQIVRLGANATLEELIATAPESVFADIASMAELFFTNQQEMLAATSVVLNPNFGMSSAQLGGADADLILDGRLIDVKTKTNASVDVVDLWQLLGYAFSDCNDEYRIREVGIYFSRHGLQVAWSLDALMELMAGAPKNLTDLRKRFSEVLYGVLPIRGPLDFALDGDRRAVRNQQTEEQAKWELEKVRRKSAKKTARVALPLVFRPSLLKTGKWHVAYAENEYVYPPSDRLNLDIRPSCGSRSVKIDRSATPLVLVVGSTRDQYVNQCCSRCLEYSDGMYGSVRQYPVPKIGPQERWRFSEPKNGRQKWHIKRCDFYENEKSESSVCNAGSQFMPGGSTVPAQEAVAADSRYCSYCLQIVRDSGPKWLLEMSPATKPG